MKKNIEIPKEILYNSVAKLLNNVRNNYLWIKKVHASMDIDININRVFIDLESIIKLLVFEEGHKDVTLDEEKKHFYECMANDFYDCYERDDFHPMIFIDWVIWGSDCPCENINIEDFFNNSKNTIHIIEEENE